MGGFNEVYRLRVLLAPRGYRTFRRLRIHLDRFTNRGVRMEELDARWGESRDRSYRSFLRIRSRLRVRVEDAFGMENIEIDSEGSMPVRASYPDKIESIAEQISNNYKAERAYVK